jgi:hypothetical protein
MTFDEATRTLYMTDAISGEFTVNVILTDEFGLGSESLIRIDILEIAVEEE